MIEPHGGILIDRYVLAPLKKQCKEWVIVNISDVVRSDLYNIAEGVFSPLTGFMNQEQLSQVLHENKMDKLPWTIPVLLDVDDMIAKSIKRSDYILLQDSSQHSIAYMKVKDIYRHNKKLHAQKVFGTTDRKHPGVNFVYEMKEWLLGGKVFVFKKNDKLKSYLSPSETRKIFEQKGFKTVAGFQTRNVLHRAHEYLQRCALEIIDGLFLQPIVGWKKSGDFTANAVIKAYKEFIKDYYPQNRVILGTLKTAMRYAGPKEAVFHAIIRKNFGCTHFIVGRDHAGVGGYYGKYAAHDIFDEIGDIGINILKFKEPLYCSKCDLIVTEKTCGHNTNKYHQEISGTLVRRIIKEGKQPQHQIFRPEVYSLLKKEFKKHNLFYT